LAPFDSRGRAAAYIAIDDLLTVYLWSGTPAAYLQRQGADEFDVYGFNGKHLGWFVDGVVRDHAGRVSCATAARMEKTQLEPFKGFKEFKPFKSFTEFSPSKPLFRDVWAPIPCSLAAAGGTK